MANYSCSLIILFLIIISASVSGEATGGCSYLATVGGGCPDKYECMETCRPCYRGFGKVKYGCVGPTAPIPYWVCECYFEDGAPCPPSGPPKCPGMWPRPATSFNSVNNNNLTLHS